MPRNRFTPAMRKRERAQLARQQKELALIGRSLKRGSAEPAVELDDPKAPRRTRRANNRRFKPERFRRSDGTQQS